MFVGVFVLALGVVFLLKNVGVIEGNVGEIIWPVLIIALGASLLFKKRHS